jgi:hypothetical protein
MSSFADIRLPSHTFTVRVQDYMDVLLRATDPSAEIRRFESRLRTIATERASELDAVDDPDVEFATDVLLPTRLRNAAEHIVPELVETEALSDFLHCSVQLGAEQLAVSEGPADIAEVITGVLDAVHSYLVAHDVVSDAYMAGERTLAARLLTPQSHTEAAKPTREPDTAADQAAKNDLALAA